MTASNMIRHLLNFLDASSSATGIDFTRDDDDYLANVTTTSASMNATHNETNGDGWSEDSGEYAFQSLTFYIILTIFLSLILIPLCCISYARVRRSVQPVDMDASASPSRNVPVIMTKEEVAKRMDELKEQFAKGEVQKVLAPQDFEIDGTPDEEAGVVTVAIDPEEDKSTSSLSKRTSIKSIMLYDDSSRHLSGRSIRLTLQKTAPNCCAICLNYYRVGEAVVWSLNPSCRHAFHADCMLGWLVKLPANKPGMCPCCRQAFMEVGDSS